MITCQIINQDGDIVSYVNLADEDSFDSLSEFLDGLAYSLEEIAQ